jgi:ribosomal-protein-alanine N-acetyltransferase
MRQDDVPEVSRVERECFSNPWPQSAYRRELRNPANNHYIVLRHHSDQPVPRGSRGEGRGPLALLPFVRKPETTAVAADQIVGFAGMWVLFDEAHVTTIGVLPRHRGKGLGELMLIDLFEEAVRRGAEWLTLEVRVSNESAQALYRKYGFTRQGVRRRYYSDNG